MATPKDNRFLNRALILIGIALWGIGYLIDMLSHSDHGNLASILLWVIGSILIIIGII
jgi:hypothetical protein